MRSYTVYKTSRHAYKNFSRSKQISWNFCRRRRRRGKGPKSFEFRAPSKLVDRATTAIMMLRYGFFADKLAPPQLRLRSAQTHRASGTPSTYIFTRRSTTTHRNLFLNSCCKSRERRASLKSGRANCSTSGCYHLSTCTAVVHSSSWL